MRASADNVFGTRFQTTFPCLPPYSKGKGRLKTPLGFSDDLTLCPVLI
ncbi:hypothetical protein HMPREF9418_2655 [Neisseria macacae ATCC 33926]|uniref:Uncharacterized protein n=1 Tax=Neisseria macacae ATCC 33926 TaxID=997348 RepID=A0AA36UGW5_9NEIS|nr:hypothetical protein HMPREF9418_2655 [Neisseria macacae ATCC 33926]